MITGMNLQPADVPARGDARRPVRRGRVAAGRARWPLPRPRRPTAGPAKPPAKAKAKSVIQIFLWGGMSHNDTWDPKPDAATTTWASSRKAIPTNVDGIQLGELFPKLAKQADKYLAHPQHDPPQQRPRDGGLPDADRPRARASGWPIRASGPCSRCFKSPGYKGLIPPYVVLTQPQGRFSEEGFLGPKIQTVRHRRRSERGPLRGGGRRRPRHHRRPAEGPPRTARQDEHAWATPWPPVRSWPPPRRPSKQAYELILGQGKEVFDLAKEKAGTARPLRPPHVRAGMPGGAADGRGGRALHRHQLPRRLGHAQQPLRRPCAGSARNWTRAWPRCCRI